MAGGEVLQAGCRIVLETINKRLPGPARSPVTNAIANSYIPDYSNKKGAVVSHGPLFSHPECSFYFAGGLIGFWERIHFAICLAWALERLGCEGIGTPPVQGFQ